MISSCQPIVNSPLCHCYTAVRDSYMPLHLPFFIAVVPIKTAPLPRFRPTLPRSIHLHCSISLFSARAGYGLAWLGLAWPMQVRRDEARQGKARHPKLPSASTQLQRVRGGSTHTVQYSARVRGGHFFQYPPPLPPSPFLQRVRET